LPAPELQTSNDTSICSGSQVTLYAYGNGTLVWNTGDTTQQITVSPTSTTTYSVTLTSSGGCTSEANITVSVNEIPEADAGNDTSICQGESIQLHAEGGTSYLLYPSNTLDDPSSPTPLAHPTNTTTYTVIVSNGNCSATDSVTIIVNPVPYVFAGNDTTIQEGTPIQLNVTTDATNPSFIWTPSLYLSQNNIPNPVSTPQSTITYIITVTSENGCSNSDSITITVVQQTEPQLIIYNTFTPNNDGINDTWHIEGIEMYPDNFLTIYNRDGMKVYEKKGYANEWDGKYYGNDLPAATYYYILDLGNGSEPLKGHVTIIR
jgi:gliding motility-associated-like protein